MYICPNMKERKTQKKEIDKEARELLKQGMPKQEAFETLVDKYKYAKDVADVVKNIPSAERIQKYGVWNTVLLIWLIIIELLVIVTSPSIGILWYGLLIYAVAKKLVKYYGWITLLAVLGALGSIATVALSGPGSFSSISFNASVVTILLLLVLYIPTCILPYWLEKKLCPAPTERKEMYSNSEGEKRMRLVYQFHDEIVKSHPDILDM